MDPAHPEVQGLHLPQTITVNARTFYFSPANPTRLLSYTHERATKRATYMRKRGRDIIIKKLRCPAGQDMKYIFVLYERMNLARRANGSAVGEKRAAAAAMADAVRAVGTRPGLGASHPLPATTTCMRCGAPLSDDPDDEDSNVCPRCGAVHMWRL